MKSGQTDDNDRLLFGRRRSANNNRALKPSNPYWICTTSTYQSFFNYIVVVYLTIFFFWQKYGICLSHERSGPVCHKFSLLASQFLLY